MKPPNGRSSLRPLLLWLAPLAFLVIFYFYPDDVVRLYAHILAEGFEPTALKVTHYGMREFSLVDPDGHVLSFGQDADESQPTAGSE